MEVGASRNPWGCKLLGLVASSGAGGRRPGLDDSMSKPYSPMASPDAVPLQVHMKGEWLAVTAYHLTVESLDRSTTYRLPPRA